MKDRAAIVGIGTTPFAKTLPESEEDLAVLAIQAALEDAGISAADVDGLVSYSIETTDEDRLALDLGMGEIGFFARSPHGGGAGAATVGLGALGIAAGQANVVVAWRSRKRGAPTTRPWAGWADAVLDNFYQWSRPYGLTRPVDDIATLARRYMHTYGATRDHLANIALTFREHANRNPAAMMANKTLSREEYMAARWISEPLCLFDNCLESDGAAAVVLVHADRAKDHPHPPAYVHAFAQGISPETQVMTNYYASDALRSQAWACADGLWKRSDYKAADVRVAQMYDAFSPEVLFTLEGYGFCGRGEAGPFTENGNIGVGGRLALNTSGGSLSEVYLHGYNLVIEAVRQIRGTSTNQVPDAECSFVSSSDCVPTGALVLRK
jgi:acetyl-CoA acetyltransferase